MWRFLDPDSQRTFDDLGFVVVPLLSDDEIDELLEAFESAGPVGAIGFHASPDGRSRTENERISARIRQAVGPRLSTVLRGHSVIGAAFLAKAGGDDGALAIHQDWTSVDERRSSSLNVWCALGDVSLDDGPLEVVVGSHRWFHTHRSPAMPSVHLPFSAVAEELLVAVPVRRGEAICYDHRLFHGSRPNRSGRLRLAAQLGVAAEAEPLVMCFPAVDGSVELREVAAGSFFDGVPTRPAGAIGVRSLIERAPRVSEEEVLDRFAREAASRR